MSDLPTDASPTRPRASSMQRASLTIVAFALSLAGAELVVRGLGLTPARFGETRHLESADKRRGLDLYPSDPRGAFPIDLRDREQRAPFADLSDLEVWADHAPHGVPGFYSDELCRVPSEGAALPPRSAARRVVIVGDSFAEGQGVPFEGTVAARLTALLGPDHEVLSCGRRGYDFALEPDDARGMRRWIDAHILDADVLLYAMTLNDPARSEAFAARQTYVDDWIVDRRRMLAAGDSGERALWSPRLLALLDDRIEALRIGAATERWYREMVEAPNAAGWQSTVEQLASLDAALRTEGRRLVIALWPLMFRLETEGSYPFTSVHARVVADLAARDLRVLDTLPAFLGARSDSLWVHDVDHHPNEEGHRRFAEAVAPSVRDALGESAPERTSP